MSVRYEAVIFDLDGTLIDSAPGLQMALARAMASQGLPEPNLAQTIRFIGSGVPKLVARALDWAGASQDRHAAVLAAFRGAYDPDPMRGTTLYPGVTDMLAGLHRAGLALGLCTNKPEAPARAILAALDLGPFGAVAGGDTLSVRKPDAAPLLHVVDLLGAAPTRTLYIGDSIVDWETARAAGIAYAHVEGGYQTAPIPDFAPRLILAKIAELPDRLSLG